MNGNGDKMMGNAMAWGAKPVHHDDDIEYTSPTVEKHSVVIAPQNSSETEPREMPRCLRTDEQLAVRQGGPLRTIKNTLGLNDVPSVEHQASTVRALLPPPLPAKTDWLLPARLLGQTAFQYRNVLGMIVAATLSAAGVAAFFMYNPAQWQQSQQNDNTQTAARAGTNMYAPTSQPTENKEQGDNNTSATTPQSKSVEDLQLATSTAGDALHEPVESTGILSAVTHNFAADSAGSQNHVVKHPTTNRLIPAGPNRLVETLLNRSNKPIVRLDAVIAAPRVIAAQRGSRRIFPALLASPDFATEIRTILVTGLPQSVELTAASRDGQGGWVLVPEALGVAELVLPDEVEGTSEITIKAFGETPRPVGITLTKLTVAAADVTPDKVNNAHKAIAEALVMFERGDVDGARSILSAIVDIGNPHAAYVFAETFDPASLSERALSNEKADVERARFWYRRSLRSGFTRAAARLENLPRITREVMNQEGVPTPQ